MTYSTSPPFDDSAPDDSPTDTEPRLDLEGEFDDDWETPEFGMSALLQEPRAGYDDPERDREMEPFYSASPAVKAIMQNVLKLESRRLSRRKIPRGITGEVVHIIKRAIPE